MKKQIIRIFIFSLIITFGFLYMRGKGLVLGTQAHQIGDLLFTWPGSTTHDPIFTEGDFKPGDCVIKDVDVENQGSNSSIIGVYSDGETDSDSLSSVLTIEITEGGNLYGPLSLTTFASDSDVINQIQLSNLGNGDSTTYFFEICFPEDAGNEHQGDNISFDLKFGEITPPIRLPDKCKALEGVITKVIEGTPGNDNIHGSTASELIIAKGGNDRIHPSSGSDCILAGAGNDRVIGTTGNEIIIGGPGNDNLSGGTGNDYIEGGSGNDRISGGSGNDEIYGQSGNDNIRGGSGNDYIYGGAGNDKINGGSGEDFLFGQGGNDNIKGVSHDDFLNGGPGTDRLHGGSGTDTCLAGEINTSCEL